MIDLKDLKSKAVIGSLWAIVEKFSLQIVQFIVAVVLARILEPKDYGLIALTIIFTTLSSAIIDGGFEKTLISARDLLPIQVSSVFYINIFLGLVLTAILYFSAGRIALFFNEPQLTTVLRVTSFGLVLNAFTQIQRLLLMKELQFKKISLAQIMSALAGGVVGVVMAYRGGGVWALVYSGLVFQLITVAIFWIRSDWYPQWTFSYSSIKKMLPYGSRVMVISLLFFIMLQFNTIIVGKLFSSTELGYFNRGGRLPDFLISIIQSIILKMAFPLFVKVRENNRQLEIVLRKTTQVVAFISFPLLALMIVNATDIMVAIFTAKWNNSIVFMELFCVIALFEPFVMMYRELILAKGHAGLLMNIFMITSAGEVLLILFIARYGVIFIILATIISKIIQYFVYVAISSRVTSVSWKAQINWIRPYLIVSVIMGLMVKGLGYLFVKNGMPMLTGLALKILAGGLIYLLLAWTFRLNELSFIKSLFRQFERRFLLELKKRMLSFIRV